MPPVEIESLIGVPVVISSSNRDKVPFRPGSRFEFPIVLTHNGQHPLEWSQGQPLNISYRWLTPNGEIVEREGLRTALPVGSLAPGARLELDVAGISPDDEGSYLLQLSLVLERIHWACDVGSDGWTQVDTLITPAPAWPAELENSRGGRALRGATAAAELARLVAKKTVAGKLSSGFEAASIVTSDPGCSTTATDKHEPARRGLRNWLRGALGVRGLEAQLSEVIQLASRQEEHALELEQQIGMLRQELQGDPPSLRERAVRSKPQASSTRGASTTRPL